MRTYAQTYIYACMHTYIHTHTHKHAYIHIDIQTDIYTNSHFDHLIKIVYKIKEVKTYIYEQKHVLKDISKYSRKIKTHRNTSKQTHQT